MGGGGQKASCDIKGNQKRVTSSNQNGRSKAQKKPSAKSVKTQGAKIQNIPQGDTGEDTSERRVASRGNTEEDGTD